MPTWDSLIPVALHVAMQEDRLGASEFKSTVADFISMPENLRTMMYKSGNGNIIEDRAGWAISLLAKAGLLEKPRMGIYTISDLGRTLYEKHGDSINNAIVRVQPKYIQHLRKRDEKRMETVEGDSTQNTEFISENSGTPQDLIENSFSEINSALKDEILDEIIAKGDKFFEGLVVKLLMKMGYGGSLKGEGTVTPFSRDGGIDGIIREDKLGFSNIYIQAKCYALDRKISSPEIQAFVGAKAHLEGKGLFVTTASFTKGAKECAEKNHIVLVNGDNLANLMLEYNLGVSTVHAYEIKKIDSDFFDENI